MAAVIQYQRLKSPHRNSLIELQLITAFGSKQKKQWLLVISVSRALIAVCVALSFLATLVPAGFSFSPPTMMDCCVGHEAGSCSSGLLLSSHVAQLEDSAHHENGGLSTAFEVSAGVHAPSAETLAPSQAKGSESTRVDIVSRGRFRFPYLQVGTYEITVEVPGFARLVRRLTVTVGQALDLQLKLTVADVAENVNVAGDLPLVETVRTQFAETLLPREIDSLPLNGRNYLDLAALTPGVTRSNPVWTG